MELPATGSVLECTQAATGLQRPQAQALLGRFLFSGWDEHDKAVSVLSGGERRRLALAHVVASGANFLLLDEPTNHLDLESREALEAALEAFPARCCSSRTTGPCSTRSPAGRWRSKTQDRALVRQRLGGLRSGDGAGGGAATRREGASTTGSG